jgi:hypothetical protein
MQARSGGLDDVEGGIGLRGLGGHNAASHALGEEAVVVLNELRRHSHWGRRRREGGGLHRLNVWVQLLPLRRRQLLLCAFWG